MSATKKRLKTDYQKVVELIERSNGSLKLLRASGTPPRSYEFEFNCPSLVSGGSGHPEIGNRHRVEIKLGENYPFTKPTIKMLTPIFNPHIFSTGNFCLGSQWRPTETLDSLVIWIGAILLLDPKVLDFKSPADSAASRWAQQNMSKLPLGQMIFKSPQKRSSRIRWNG
jgi:ubiquitin-protein ligase